jgi:hypothetical protein
LREECRQAEVFENRVLRRIFGPKRDKVIGDWRKAHEEELNLYCSPSIVRVIKLRMRRVGHVAHMRERVLMGNLRERDHLEDPSIDGRIILS